MPRNRDWGWRDSLWPCGRSQQRAY